MDAKIKFETPGQAIDAAGGTTKVAEHFGVSTAAVATWRRNGLPARRMLKWQELLEQLGASAAPTVFGQK